MSFVGFDHGFVQAGPTCGLVQICPLSGGRSRKQEAGAGSRSRTPPQRRTAGVLGVLCRCRFEMSSSDRSHAHVERGRSRRSPRSARAWLPDISKRPGYQSDSLGRHEPPDTTTAGTRRTGNLPGVLVSCSEVIDLSAKRTRERFPFQRKTGPNRRSVLATAGLDVPEDSQMTTTHRFLKIGRIVAGVSFTLAVCMIVCDAAAQPGRGGRGGRDGSGGPGRPGGRWSEMIRQMDKNGDGQIQPDEVPERARPMFRGSAERRGLDPNKPIPIDKLQPPEGRGIGAPSPARPSPPATPPACPRTTSEERP